MGKSFFERLLGFPERNGQNVLENVTLEGEYLVSAVNGARIRCGTFVTPSLTELRDLADMLRSTTTGPTVVTEVVGNVAKLHTIPESNGALFQAASQFNALEMISPEVTPEQGISRYEFDKTQGPACALACAGGTIYRNYFLPVGGGIGQTASRQLDTLAEVHTWLTDPGRWPQGPRRLWQMQNGYALAEADGLAIIRQRLASLGARETAELRGRLRIGVQRSVAVTLEGSGNIVSQAYCAALPVAYCAMALDLWEPFARLVLQAAYEATLSEAALNQARTGNAIVYLTKLGGGAFGNRAAWIVDAMEGAISQFQWAGLDIRIVSFGRPDADVRRLLG